MNDADVIHVDPSMVHTDGKVFRFFFLL